MKHGAIYIQKNSQLGFNISVPGQAHTDVHFRNLFFRHHGHVQKQRTRKSTLKGEQGASSDHDT